MLCHHAGAGGFIVQRGEYLLHAVAAPVPGDVRQGVAPFRNVVVKRVHGFS